MEEIARLLRKNAVAYRDRVHKEFFLDSPQARQFFPLSLDSTHVELANALAWVFDNCDEWGNLKPAAVERVEDLGLNHRRHGFAPSLYTTFAKYLILGLDLFEVSPSQRAAADKAVYTVSKLMKSAAEKADLEGEAPAHQARVIEVERPNREIAMIRLETAMPVDYRPGQYFPVTTSMIQGRWVHLAAATPANITGQLDFHIQSPHSGELEAAGVLKRSKLADSWTFGQPRGTFPAGQADVIICFGTGWAAARAYLLGLVDAAEGAPRWETSVYAVGNSPGQHYDAVTQDNLQRLGLNIQRLVYQAEDPWLLGAKEQAGNCQQTPDPTGYILDKEGKDKHYVLVGPAHEVDSAADKLAQAKVLSIEPHAWAAGRAWGDNQ